MSKPRFTYDYIHVRFQFRKPRGAAQDADDITPQTPGVVQIILKINKRVYGPYSTDIFTTRAIWDGRDGRTNSAKLKELNLKLSQYQQAVEDAHYALIKGGEQAIDGEIIMSVVRAGDILGEGLTLPQLYEEFILSRKTLVVSDRKKRVESQIAPSTFSTYPKRWVMLQAYLTHIARTQIPVRAIEHKFATNLKEWMLTQQKGSGQRYSVVYANKVIQLAKQLMSYAVSKGYIKSNPLDSYSCRGHSISNPKPLTSAQIDHLETCELPPVLRHACDSWIVAAELCLHYADYSELPKMKFIQGDGIRYIQHDRQKQAGSKLLQTVNVTERAERILEKWGGPKGLYYTSSAYFSKLLKTIARLANLRDESGELIPLQFGQGRDSGLTQRVIDGANGMQLSKIAGWTKPVYAEKYVGNPLAIVEAFAKSSQPKKPKLPPIETLLPANTEEIDAWIKTVDVKGIYDALAVEKERILIKMNESVDFQGDLATIYHYQKIQNELFLALCRVRTPGGVLPELK